MGISVNLRSFRQQVSRSRRRMRNFLTRLEKKAPPGLQQVVAEADKEAWRHTDCLDCANCCKTMSPTYTRKDIRRISEHLGMSQRAFREKWLYKDKTGDWMNVKQPCQFLDLKTNMCNIYEVRPRDCAGFPHHHKKDECRLYAYVQAEHRVLSRDIQDGGGVMERLVKGAG